MDGATFGRQRHRAACQPPLICAMVMSRGRHGLPRFQDITRTPLPDLNYAYSHLRRAFQPFAIDQVGIFDCRGYLTFNQTAAIGQIEFEGAAIRQHTGKAAGIFLIALANILFLQSFCRGTQLLTGIEAK